jgi:hypothetical protein
MSRSSEGGERRFHFLDRLHLHPWWLLAIFAVGVVAINFGRWDEWGPDGFRLYLTQAIMRTTLFDFGWVLLIVTLFIHHDARRHDLSYWWILPTYPFMPTVGLLAYLIHRTIGSPGAAPKPSCPQDFPDRGSLDG